MKKAVISEQFPRYSEILKRCGFEIVSVKPYKQDIYNSEAYHSDMQILKINNNIILLKDNDSLNNIIIENSNNYEISFTKNRIENFVYPDCVKLNVAVVGKNAVGNFKYVDSTVIDILEKYRFSLINVKQGYSKCATLIVSDEAIVTSDPSIYRAAKGKLDCLKITEGYISLCEKYGGFIGGAGFLIDESTLAFTGDIRCHPDYIDIRSFCKNHGVDLLSLDNTGLYDVGGVVVL